MIIRLQDCPPQPWRNGLGRTREIAVHPADAGSGDFLWRVSVAEVDSDAPFSRFPGIDRQIVLLDGNGFTMTLDDDRVHALSVPLQPFAFPGEAAVAVTLIDGATRDFNLMSRRTQVRGEVLPWRQPGDRAVDPAIVLVHCAGGVIDTVDGPLHAGDAWLSSGRPAAPVTLRHGAAALAVRIEPRTA
ncbi:HutD family protein [Rhodanobacter ginsengisoli]|uniref:HutD family protein n=1 Tax=Rhodanobacter ginsengisoli TaxID=418646 RepID=A0ABW0QHS0_9GAMM